jgi:hypothetical protein
MLFAYYSATTVFAYPTLLLIALALLFAFSVLPSKSPPNQAEVSATVGDFEEVP